MYDDVTSEAKVRQRLCPKNIRRGWRRLKNVWRFSADWDMN
jgi:hypothetical protein